MLGLGGNDVLKLSSPRKWRRDMIKLLGILKEKNPSAKIFITNAPAVRLSPALPQPIRFILGHLSALHDRNTKEFTRDMENVFYYHQPTEVIEDFFSDGLHPSEKGYDIWSETMLDFAINNYGIKKL
jgi:lysophospholipase L1-like esterase